MKSECMEDVDVVMRSGERGVPSLGCLEVGQNIRARESMISLLRVTQIVSKSWGTWSNAIQIQLIYDICQYH